MCQRKAVFSEARMRKVREDQGAWMRQGLVAVGSSGIVSSPSSQPSDCRCSKMGRRLESSPSLLDTVSRGGKGVEKPASWLQGEQALPLRLS